MTDIFIPFETWKMKRPIYLVPWFSGLQMSSERENPLFIFYIGKIQFLPNSDWPSPPRWRYWHDTSPDGFSEQQLASSACFPAHNRDMGNIVGKQSCRRTDRPLRTRCWRHHACLVSCPSGSTSSAFGVPPSESSAVSASLVCCLTYRATLW